jgi:hypothetical protein
VSALPLEGFEYPRTYRMAPWAYALTIGAAVLMLALGIGALVLIMRAYGSASAGLLLMSVLVLPLELLGLYLLASALRTSLVLSADAIEVHETFRVRRLARCDIAGRRLLKLNYGQTMTQLIPSGAGMKPFKFSQSGLRTDAFFDAWMASLPDLDAQEILASEAQVAANAELGATPEERMARLAAGKKVASALTVITWAAAAWGYMYPHPYAAALLALALLPWLAIALAAKSAGLYRIDTRRNDVRPSVAIAIYLPGLVLLMRALQDIGVLELQRALLYAALTAALFCWAAVMSDAAARSKPAIVILLLALGCPYGYGVVVLGNSQLDRAAGDHYEVNVLARHISGGRNRSYYLTLAPWGPRSEAREVTVPRTLYANAQPGQPVCIHQGPGALGISWYAVSSCW